MSEVRTYTFQGLEVSKPSSYKSLNSSSVDPNLSFEQHDQHNENTVYNSLIDQFNFFLLNNN